MTSAPVLRSHLFLATTLAAVLIMTIWSVSALATEPIALGSRRELFVDNSLIESLQGGSLRLHHPTPREIAIVHDQPWEGNVSYYHTVFRDGDLFRMYYRGAQAGPRQSHPEAVGHQVVCYAESSDGMHWTKPSLRLHEFAGSKDNNIIWTGIGAHNFAPFKDPNPACQPDARYKAIGHGPGGLYAFRSADGIHWSLIQDTPVITRGAFDSQNLAFFDTHRNRYVDFHRGFNKGVRAIMTCTSTDFTNWTEPEWIEFEDERVEHLYTNQTTAYHRAPHLFLAFPKRFLPSRNPTIHRNSGVSDIVFMSSRDGRRFHRWGEAFLRPGLQRERWVNRNNFVAWGIVETQDTRLGLPPELSFYSMEGYYVGDDCQMRRYSLRPDGFVSVNGPHQGAELTTKPITFSVPEPGTDRSVSETPESAVMPLTDHPLRGTSSIRFTKPAILELENTRNLGRQATLAVVLRGVPMGHRRLFSTYNGGSTKPGELYFDINSGGHISAADGFSIRFNYNDQLVGGRFEDVGDWSREADAQAVHHVAATWNDGQVALYFDGRKIASGGQPGAGELEFQMGDLRFGEDYPPTALSNEPFLGDLDDLLVLRRALSEKEIAQLAQSAAESVLDVSREKGILLTFEDSDTKVQDRLVGDGEQAVTVPARQQPGEVELRVNFSTSAAGSLRCELQDVTGQPIPGFTLKDCDELYGDSLDQPISWKGRREVKPLAGKPIRLRFVIRDADLYAIRFGR